MPVVNRLANARPTMSKSHVPRRTTPPLLVHRQLAVTTPMSMIFSGALAQRQIRCSTTIKKLRAGVSVVLPVIRRRFVLTMA